MENTDELMIQDKLSYYSYSSPDFTRIPLVIFFGGNSININAKLKYQIAFHLLNSLFAFLFFSVLTPISLPISFFILIFNLGGVHIKSKSKIKARETVEIKIGPNLS